jgi:sugar/nucleoside kinase (ribokinase family)
MRGEASEKVVVAGHACVDLIPALAADPTREPGGFSNVGPLEVRCGGSVVNTGEALVALGRPVHLVAAVGADHLGGVLAERLRALDPAARLEPVAHGTSYSVVLERGGSRTLWHHEGSNVAFTGREVDPADAALVHLGYATALPALLLDDLAPFLDLLARISAAGATSSVDFATVDPRADDVGEWPQRLARLLPRIDIVSPSADDLVSLGWLPPRPRPEDVADAARRLVDAGAGIAFVTDGERGAHLRVADATRLARGGRVLARLGPDWPGVAVQVPAVPVETVVGTNGAGDTASAGLIDALLNGYTPRDASRAAVALAAERVAGRELRAVDIT